MGEEELSNGGMLYHEVQESKLCGVHCVNCVLQGPFFSEFDLAALASDLDRNESLVFSSFSQQPSHNVSLQGDFSIQVLQKAMEVWDLQVIPLNSPVAEPAQVQPELEKAFICHLEDHWFCIRKVNGEWYNFNSLYPAPEHLSKFYLSAYLATLTSSGWSIFVVRGNFPRECPMASSEASNGYGQWLLPEDAERMTKSFNTVQPQQPHVLDARQEFTNPFSTYQQDEEEDLNAAIAASLMDSTLGMVHAEPATSLSETLNKSLPGPSSIAGTSESQDNPEKNSSSEFSSTAAPDEARTGAGTGAGAGAGAGAEAEAGAEAGAGAGTGAGAGAGSDEKKI